jgi:hypothetical protein
LERDAGELEEQTAEAYPLYPLYRYPRLRYKHRPYDGKITVLANEVWYEADPTMGWGEVATGGLDVYKIPGDHNTYITKNIHLVADRLKECLEKAKGENRAEGDEIISETMSDEEAHRLAVEESTSTSAGERHE